MIHSLCISGWVRLRIWTVSELELHRYKSTTIQSNLLLGIESEHAVFDAQEFSCIRPEFNKDLYITSIEDAHFLIIWIHNRYGRFRRLSTLNYRTITTWWVRLSSIVSVGVIAMEDIIGVLIWIWEGNHKNGILFWKCVSSNRKPHTRSVIGQPKFKGIRNRGLNALCYWIVVLVVTFNWVP